MVSPGRKMRRFRKQATPWTQDREEFKQNKSKQVQQFPKQNLQPVGLPAK